MPASYRIHAPYLIKVGSLWLNTSSPVTVKVLDYRREGGVWRIWFTSHWRDSDVPHVGPPPSLTRRNFLDCYQPWSGKIDDMGRPLP